MKKKKIFKNVIKVALIVIAIFIVIFAIHTIRNYIIILDLQNKVSQYQESKNYNIKISSTQDTGTIVKTDYYKKDNKQAVFMERNLNGEISKISMYDNGERADTFTETKDRKIVQLNTGTLISVNIYNQLETDNNWQTFLGSIIANIKSTNYEGKECYIIKGFLSSNSLTFEGAEIYIDKETGLLVKTTEAGTVSEREYKFNEIDESVLEEPDISQYTLKENN